MNLKIRVYFTNDNNESFMGIGIVWLLRGIEEHGSIRKAAMEMNMSYTKAYGMLKKLEKSLNQTILDRKRGGNDREGTFLTEYGKWFLLRYESFNSKIESFCKDEFDQFMKEMKEQTL
jgi:molybdate transport system regulatory protein